MNLPALERFVTVSRKFGLWVALRITYSKVRGVLLPSLRLPGAPSWIGKDRQLSVLLDAADHDLDSLEAWSEMIVTQSGSDWELCVSERPPARSTMIAALGRLRGVHPCIRIISASTAVSDDIAARWTVEQATGQFLALIAKGYVPETRSVGRLLVHLQQNSGTIAAAMIDWDRADCATTSTWEHCLVLVQRKCAYLAAGNWQLSAPRAARSLSDRGVPIEIMARND